MVPEREKKRSDLGRRTQASPACTAQNQNCSHVHWRLIQIGGTGAAEVSSRDAISTRSRVPPPPPPLWTVQDGGEIHCHPRTMGQRYTHDLSGLELGRLQSISQTNRKLVVAAMAVAATKIVASTPAGELKFMRSTR